MLLLYTLSSRSSLGGVPAGWDKLAHASAYGILGFLALRACHAGILPLRALPATLALLLSIGYGALDELHQRFVPGRDASVEDWIADALGAGAATIVLAWLTRRGPRLAGSWPGRRRG